MNENKPFWKNWKVLGTGTILIGSAAFFGIGVKNEWFSSSTSNTDLGDDNKELEDNCKTIHGVERTAQLLSSAKHVAEKPIKEKEEIYEKEHKCGTVPPPLASETIPTNVTSSVVTILSAPASEKVITSNSDSESAFGIENFFLKSNNPFSMAHNTFLTNLNGIIKSETYDSAIETKFIAAKALYDPTTFSNLSLVYAKRSGKEAALEVLSKKTVLDSIGVKCKQCMKLEDVEEMAALYKLFKARRIFSASADSWASTFSLSNYAAEKSAFIKAFVANHINIMEQAFFNAVADTMVDGNNDEKIERIIAWFHLYVPLTPDIDMLPFLAIGLERVATASDARLFMIKQFLIFTFSQFINLHYDREKLAAALEPYLNTFNRLHAHPNHFPIFSEPDTLVKFLEEQYKPKFVPPERAVLSGKPRKLNNSMVCYTNCFLQALANFLPLFETAPVWNSTFCDNRAESYKNAIRQVAMETKDPLEVKDILDLSRFSKDEQYNPKRVCYDFFKSFSGDMFGFTIICGFLILIGDKIVGIPWLSALVYPGFTPPLAYMHTMLGPLFIAHYQEPIESMKVPLHLDMNVQFQIGKKRYELYSIIYGIDSKVHALAYVRRANNKWYCTDSLKEVEEVKLEDIPLQAAQQGTQYKVLMTFYLRTEN